MSRGPAPRGAAVSLSSYNGVLLPGRPLQASNYVGSAPSLADVNGDGLDEIFFYGQAELTEQGYLPLVRR